MTEESQRNIMAFGTFNRRSIRDVFNKLLWKKYLIWIVENTDINDQLRKSIEKKIKALDSFGEQ